MTIHTFTSWAEKRFEEKSGQLEKFTNFAHLKTSGCWLVLLCHTSVSFSGHLTVIRRVVRSGLDCGPLIGTCNERTFSVSGHLSLKYSNRIGITCRFRGEIGALTLSSVEDRFVDSQLTSIQADYGTQTIVSDIKYMLLINHQ